MEARHLEIGALVADRMHLRGVGEDALLLVAQHRALFPAAFPQLVDDFHVFLGEVVARIVADLPVEADVARRTVEIGRHHVPRDTPLRQMIERRKPARQKIGMLERHRGGDAEAQIARHRRHRRNRAERIVHRHLRRVVQRRLGRAAIDVIDPHHIGDEQAVEGAAFQLDRQIGPVVEIVVARRLTGRVAPGARRLMADAGHVEGVENDAFLRRCGRECGGGGRIGRGHDGLRSQTAARSGTATVRGRWAANWPTARSSRSSSGAAAGTPSAKSAAEA